MLIQYSKDYLLSWGWEVDIFYNCCNPANETKCYCLIKNFTKQDILACATVFLPGDNADFQARPLEEYKLTPLELGVKKYKDNEEEKIGK